MVSVLLAVHFLDLGLLHRLFDFIGLMDLNDSPRLKFFLSGLALRELFLSVSTFEKSIGDDPRLVLEVIFSLGFA